MYEAIANAIDRCFSSDNLDPDKLVNIVESIDGLRRSCSLHTEPTISEALCRIAEALNRVAKAIEDNG